jgi:hypothetical protein
MVGSWRKLRSEGLHNLHSSPNIIRMIEVKKNVICRACSMDRREEECIYTVLVEKPEEKRPLGRHRRRWEDNKYDS